MIDIATVGWLTMDDIVLLDHSCRPGVVGGGALYSAIGAQIWSDRVGVHSVTGRDVYEDVRARIAARGLDGEGIGAIDGAGEAGKEPLEPVCDIEGALLSAFEDGIVVRTLAADLTRHAVKALGRTF